MDEELAGSFRLFSYLNKEIHNLYITGLSISAGDWQYCQLFEHFPQIKIGRDKWEKQWSLQKFFKKKMDKIKHVVYFPNIFANFKSY